MLKGGPEWQSRSITAPVNSESLHERYTFRPSRFPHLGKGKKW